METIKILIFEEGAATAHEHHAPKDWTFEQVLGHHQSDGHLLGEVTLLEGEIEIELLAVVGGCGPERRIHSRVHHRHRVEVTINCEPHHTHKGQNTVKHLKHIGNVPTDELLAQETNGEFVALNSTGHVEVCGGEVFSSHCPRGSSS